MRRWLKATQGSFQVPEDMRRMAEQSVTQTRQALEKYLQAVRRTAESMEQGSDKAHAGAKDMAQKTFSAVEKNLRASLDYAERLVRAKDLQEASQIQSEFVRAQAEAMQAQMKEYGSVMQSAMDTAKRRRAVDSRSGEGRGSVSDRSGDTRQRQGGRRGHG